MFVHMDFESKKKERLKDRYLRFREKKLNRSFILITRKKNTWLTLNLWQFYFSQKVHFLVPELERGNIKLLENGEKEKMIEYSFFFTFKDFL